MSDDLIRHYGGDGLLDAIAAGLEALGKGPDTATIDDLGPADEFHIGGRPATVELLDRLGVDATHHLLDVGCGIGGGARFAAATTGCRATGIDLTPHYVETATGLASWTGLSDRVTFDAGSALQMPYGDASFDRAMQLHVGMNIEDKAALFAEVARVLKPGGRFGVYDIVRIGDGEVKYPMPWSSEPAYSHLATPHDYVAALEAAGFRVETRDRHGFAVEFFQAQDAAQANVDGPPPLGLHLVMGPDLPVKLGNLVPAVMAGTLAPCEFICDLA